MKKYLLAILFFFSASSATLFSQPWMQMAEAKKANPNFYDIQSAFDEYEQSRSGEEKFLPERKQPWESEENEIPGFFPYKRWEWFWEPRVYPTGEFPSPGIILSELEKANSDNTRASSSLANWTLLGPISTVPSNGGGVGRVNCVRFNPLNSNIVWAGSPAGGLWKSTNGGTNWTSNTDQLTVLGVSDVAINPLDTTIMYIATGDGDASDTYSAGILKSTDGGVTWNTTGLVWTASQLRVIGRLIINPTNPAILLAATSNGIYRTINSGVSWTSVRSGNHRDIEFMPGNPNIVYAVTNGNFYKSSDGGVTWGAAITTGLATTNVGRISIAVTPANPNVVYALYSRADNYGFLGLYKSSNAAVSFTQQSSTPNILGWSANGGDTGGQGWYDLALAASPTTENNVFVGGIHIWRSTNGGTTWTISANVSAHADVHDIYFANGSGTTLYAGTDGGVFNSATTGTTAWTNKSATLQIQQEYKLSNSATNPAIVVTGSQDNGTNKITGTAMSKILGGDGMECIVDYTNANIIYAELYYGDINVCSDGGTNWNSIAPVNPDNTNGAWVTPYVMHPTNHSTIYAGYKSIFKTTNAGTSWSSGTNTISTTYRSMAVAPSNGNYVYAATLSQIYRSSDGAVTWTNISSGLPISSLALTYIAVKYNDPLTLWVTVSGYSSVNKVFKSTDGGANWTNITGTGLPNVPVNCIVNEATSPVDILYVGTDIGVYYINNGIPSWISYSTGLPRVVVTELEIQYSSAKLRAATYGRGIWQTDLNTGVGIAEAEHHSFNVYPNPSEGILNIELNNESRISSVMLLDILGKKVKEISSLPQNESVIRMNISDLPNGIYSLMITSPSGISAQKISLLR